MQNKAFSYIGLARKSGNVISGESMTEKAIKNQKAKLVIVAEDASDNTKKLFQNMCTYYNVPIYFFGKKMELGHAIGKEYRASLAIVDEGLAKGIIKSMDVKIKLGGK